MTITFAAKNEAGHMDEPSMNLCYSNAHYVFSFLETQNRDLKLEGHVGEFSDFQCLALRNACDQVISQMSMAYLCSAHDEAKRNSLDYLINRLQNLRVIADEAIRRHTGLAWG